MEKITQEMDKAWMTRALDEAARADVALTRPNPRVGCVIVSDGRMMGAGFHEKAGQAHAEVNAIRSARAHGGIPAGATVYVTLEPCCHQGKTPPCVPELIQLKPRRVVIGCLDANPQVAGKGVKALQESGIDVTVGVEREACENLNKGFLYWMKHQRPRVIAKVAVSRDWKSASVRQRLVLSCPETQPWVHRQRQQSDALAVGAATLQQDQPRLDARFGLIQRQPPALIIFDSKLSMPTSGSFFTSDRETIVVTTFLAPQEKMKTLDDLGFHVLPVKESNGHVDLNDALAHLGKMSFREIYLEPGPRLLASFLPFINELVIVQSPVEVGERGLNWIHGRVTGDSALPFSKRDFLLKIGQDTVWRYT